MIEITRKPNSKNNNDLAIYSFLQGCSLVENFDTNEGNELSEFNFIYELCELYNSSDSVRIVKKVKLLIEKYKNLGGLDIDFLGTVILKLEEVIQFSQGNK